METIAVYWEPKIKIYGFNEITDLILLGVSLTLKQMPPMGLMIKEMAETNIKILLVLGQHSEDGKLSLYLLIEKKWEERMINHLRQLIVGDIGDSIHITSPAGLIYFHGPHFGDRYGIANSAFGVLAKNGIPVLASACSAASIYLVLHEEKLENAKKFLSEAFQLPPSGTGLSNI